MSVQNNISFECFIMQTSINPSHSNNNIQHCWEANPRDRPRFAHLVKQFCSFLEQDSGYLELSATNPIQLPPEKAECGEGAAKLVEKA